MIGQAREEHTVDIRMKIGLISGRRMELALLWGTSKLLKSYLALYVAEITNIKKTKKRDRVNQ